MLDKVDHAKTEVESNVLHYSRPRRLKLIGIVALIVAAMIVAAGLASRFYSSAKTATWTNDQAVPSVQTIKLANVKAGGDLILPGDVEAFSNATINAQVNGYVQKWYADIGTAVKAGDLLAQIDPKPYQAALDQTKSQLARDQATLNGAQIDLKRQQALFAIEGTSKQALDDQAALVGTDQGVVQADQANIETAEINLGYTRIVAPFDGIVTARTVDIGALVSATSGTALFTMASEKKLRVYLHLPQVYAALIKPGLAANFSVPEHPGRTFTALFAGSAEAVASQTGTQLVQFQIDNADGALKPGDYAEMHLALPVSGAIRVPATALMFRDAGMMVATVDPSNHVVMKTVAIRADLGTAVEVASGLSVNDVVIDNPTDSLQAGDLVRPSVEPQTSQPN